MDLTGKRLLVLGGTSASLDLVKQARAMGVYTIVTDNNTTGVAKDLADETAMVSTTDIDGLIVLAKERKADGIFCGPSEFNLRNVIRACEKSGYPCYTTMDIWDKCACKDIFKQYCVEYGVDTPRQYDIDLNTPMSELEKIDYPIIIKPVDGCSSAGITVCQKPEDVADALKKAYEGSVSQKIIAEKYIENGGETFAIRYWLQDGEAYPYLTIDNQIVDPVNRTCLICQLSRMPSRYTDYYMEHMDVPTRKMLKGMGLRNGTVSIQALPYKGKIYFHEMSYRLGGGMIFKMTGPLTHVNDMQYMIRYAVGGPALTQEEIDAIDLNCGGRFGSQLMVPLNVGTIGRIEGVDLVKKDAVVQDFLQYYYEGNTVRDAQIGTLSQNFCRITFFTSNMDELVQKIKYYQQVLRIYDTQGNLMNIQPFDTDRLKG